MSSKMKNCKSCNEEIAKSAKVCPHCGAKNKKPLFKRASFWIVIVVILGVILLGGGSGYELSEDAQNMTKREYKAACETVTYKELARNVDSLVGNKYCFEGEVQQVAYESESGQSEYLISVTKGDFDIYTDNLYVYYEIGENKRILEGDIVKLYGEVSGEKSYTSILGESITIPAFVAVYAEIQ